MPSLTHWIGGATALLAVARVAVAQPAADPLLAITSDPAIPVGDPARRAHLQALLGEGAKQHHARAYEQALANYLAAYAELSHPKILLEIASVLRDLGRLADAANTYQRYLLDPGTGAERVAEVKQLLRRLDEQLAIVTVRVSPQGAAVSIDGGPFVAVGSSLVTRVRPGLHLVRARAGGDSLEVTVNAFEGEPKDVAAALPAVPPAGERQPRAPEHVHAWLTTGTAYASDGSGPVRRVRAGFGGPEIAAVLPVEVASEEWVVAAPPRTGARVGGGLIGVLRIDGELRGAAAGAGVSLWYGRLAGDVMFLKSEQAGAYLGARYRLFTGPLRPYLALGVPAFVYDELTEGGEVAKKLAIGARLAGGLELVVTRHLGVHVDLGYEHFFGVEDAGWQADLFVPTVGVIGRL